MILAGRLRHRILIQRPTAGTDARGGATASWSTYAERWAAYEPVAGREAVQADQRTGIGSARLRLRYLAGLGAAMRVLLPRLKTTLGAALDAVSTTLTVSSAAGFPTTLRYRVRIEDELLEVTGGQGTTTWTVTRGVDGTVATAHPSGVPVWWMVPLGIEQVADLAGEHREVEVVVSEVHT